MNSMGTRLWSLPTSSQTLTTLGMYLRKLDLRYRDCHQLSLLLNATLRLSIVVTLMSVFAYVQDRAAAGIDFADAEGS